MASLHSGNLRRRWRNKCMELGACFVREDGRVFILLRDIFDLKPLTKEEIAYFIDFAREQYLV